MKDLLIGDNLFKSDARALRTWWNRIGHVYFGKAFGRGKTKGRRSVWLQRA